jgi:ABC-type dipeptide/oligopeptide/nickel transport system permease component
MGKYLLGRIAVAVPTLLFLTLAAFLLNAAARGDPAEQALRAGGNDPSPAEIEAYRESLGLNDPLPVRYVTWLGGLFQGDLGKSFLDQRDVSEKLGERIVPTLRLGVTAFLASSIVGISLGVIFGLKANTAIDYGGRLISLLLAAVPSFWLALLLIVYIGERSDYFPVAGYGGFKYLVLPVIALSCGPAASLMRFTRNATIEVWRDDYVRTARAKGMTETRIAIRHALPNAMLPIITLLGLRFGQILAGAIVIETIFSWPGLGSELVKAISGRDLPVIGAYVLLTGLGFVIVNLLSDLGYAIIDPRVRLGDRQGGAA